MTRNDDRIREIRKNRFKTMNWAYWAQPKPIAVRDGKSIGLSRYAKLERGNLNSPKTIAVRDDRSSATIAVRGVFREQNDYFNHRGTRRCFFGRCRGTRQAYNRRKSYKSNVNHSVDPLPILPSYQRPYSAIVVCYLSLNTLEAILTSREAPLEASKAWSSKKHNTSSLAAVSTIPAASRASTDLLKSSLGVLKLCEVVLIFNRTQKHH
ncbi:hypothetical protein E3N88_21273 [Mikania micrantha]|uniref:Uncharacterized protein n=1 Tax=Mikania micrantha TaxID=192012 RepID=A0A5N6NM51_9ASTR|nr:hypothetical protein E3N88_21270 [Mikania micrantha]KAD4889200.1 hypothetical protein E3N88_21273 [Mikania micrantha]